MVLRSPHAAEKGAAQAAPQRPAEERFDRCMIVVDTLDDQTEIQIETRFSQVIAVKVAA